MDDKKIKEIYLKLFRERMHGLPFEMKEISQDALVFAQEIAIEVEKELKESIKIGNFIAPDGWEELRFGIGTLSVHGTSEAIKKLHEKIRNLSVSDNDKPPSTNITGGPAFGTYHAAGDMAVREGGVTLLDYFAAQVSYEAPGSMLFKILTGKEYPKSIYDDLESFTARCDLEAKVRYKKAAAMLRSREEAMRPMEPEKPIQEAEQTPGQRMNKLVGLIKSAIPYSDQITDVDMSREDSIRLTWRHTRLRITLSLSVDEIEGGMLSGSNIAILFKHCLKQAAKS